MIKIIKTLLFLKKQWLEEFAPNKDLKFEKPDNGIILRGLFPDHF